MTAVASAAADYLAVRRALGYKLEGTGRHLASFVAYLEAHHLSTVTVARALAWSTEAGQGRSAATRLADVRGFARYLQAIDPAHEVPPPGLIPDRSARAVPYLYSDADIAALMGAARGLEPPLWAATCETVIGLLAATGMRVGEVLRLDVADVNLDDGVLTVWFTKFNKSRHVPVTTTTTTALARYRQAVQAAAPSPQAPFFVARPGGRLRYPPFAKTFGRLLDTVGICSPHRRPRIHDLRHSFAVRTLLRWYSEGADVEALLPRLSTYLGHVDPASTYWYLSAAPELIALASDRIEAAGDRR